MKPKVLACELPELAADQTRQRIQLYPGPGTYVHPVGGEFTLTTDTLAEFTDDLNARGDTIALDYDHSPERGRGSRAAGWFVPETAAVEAGGGVFVDVNWTPAAQQAIRDREYRFISPTFAPAAHRTASGQTIAEPKQVGAALTNRPFFSTMEPLAADDLPLEDSLVVEEVFGADVADTLTEVGADAARALIAAANMKSGAGRVLYADPGYRKDGKPRYPLSSSDEVTAAWKTVARSQVAATYEKTQLSRIKARIRRAALKFGVTIGADETTKEKTMELTEAFAADLGVAVDADDETIHAAMVAKLARNKELEAAATTAPAITAAEVAEIKATNAKNAAKLKDAALDGAVSAFKIEAGEREFYADAYDRDPEGTEKFLADKKPIVALAKPAGHGNDIEITVGVDGVTVTADTTPIVVNGIEIPVSEDSAKAHAATVAILAKAGKTLTTCTADEYAEAAVSASLSLGLPT